MTVIKNHQDGIPLVQDCCICGGVSTIMQTASAKMVANGQEYALYYHKVCLNESTKLVVEKKLKELAGVA